ncbi:MAG: trimeric intracellular cation channel family protein [Aliidiomarina sp.]|uniref:trimeric intracellular cation channel family protein n=1 Tax=Aliidiomarina sp. TaxID=1872439 RepID=UPI0025BF9881|nr:trimeric intracellular cation channel family protein [Aliidiomarina sp.]MCH8501938.1 trimeric intracellular cation channel family protein [Aliidiomarina sp.]MCL5255140.1 trimeric intracellular cation channel family protein [Gammaproteobacteria bacterium]
MDTWFYIADLAGVAVFAIAGTLLAFRKQMDGFGVIVLASVTAIGGGTTRDLILDVPVFWLHDPTYFAVIAIAAFSTIIWLRYKAYIPLNRLLIADALGIAFFTVLGTEKALNAGVSPIVAIILGTMTAVFGGMLRDVLARDIPMVLKSELYATTCIAGSLIYVLFNSYSQTLAMLAAMTVTLIFRFGAIRYGWSLTVFKEHK